MIGLESLRWVLTAICGGAAVFHLVRLSFASPAAAACPSPAAAVPSPVAAVPIESAGPIPWFVLSRAENRFSEVLHSVMGAAMVVMIWPWGTKVPEAIWVAVFLACAAWFVTRAVRATTRRHVPLFFATSMAAMVWMGTTMPAQAASTPAMAMPGMTMDTTATGPIAWISGAVGGYLVLAAFWWIVRGMRIDGKATAERAHPPSLGWAALCHGMMSAGMGLALLAMA